MYIVCRSSSSSKLVAYSSRGVSECPSPSETAKTVILTKPSGVRCGGYFWVWSAQPKIKCFYTAAAVDAQEFGLSYGALACDRRILHPGGGLERTTVDRQRCSMSRLGVNTSGYHSVGSTVVLRFNDCETDGHEELQAAENGENSIRRPTNYSMRHAPDNLIKEEPSAGGVGEGLVVESAVEAGCSCSVYPCRCVQIKIV